MSDFKLFKGAWGVYQFWWYTCVGYYRRRNHHVRNYHILNLIVNDRDLLSSPFSARRNGPSTSPRKRKKRRRPLLRRPPPPREERSRNERARIHLLKDQQS
jgi:hypothetical protein